MKAAIPKENLLDPKLRSFVAKQQYIDALHYYRDLHKVSRGEAAEVIDIVRAQLDTERDRGASGNVLIVVSPLIAPQTSRAFVPPVFDDAPPVLSEEEQDEDPGSLETEAYPEEEEKPEENLNASPYALPVEVNPLEPPEEEDDPEDDLEDDDYDSNEDLDDDDYEDEDLEEEDTPELEEDLDDAPEEVEAAPEQPPAVIAATETIVEAPAEVAPALPQISTVSAIVEIPSWESLPSDLRRELSSTSLEEAIRIYWREVGCSLSEAKAHVSSWLSLR